MTISRLDDVDIARIGRLDVTYAEVGSTAGVLPHGYHYTDACRRISTDARDLDSIGHLLLSGAMHERAGFDVALSHPVVEPGSILVLRRRIAGVPVGAACRVIYVVNEPTRRGFAYGTLPGHPESGEEAFMLEADPDGSITATIRAFSRAASPLAKLAGPMGRVLQSSMTKRYLDALEGATH